jgi:Uma2 family endonuclease
MNIGSASITPTESVVKQVVPPKTRKMTIEHFLRYYARKEDGYKYEFNNGVVEKTTSMNPAQFFIYKNLMVLFFRLFPKVGGMFGNELITYTSPDHFRKPDIAYLNDDQIRRATEGEGVIPEFMVETISETDQIYPLEQKIEEYFKAGVKVLWLIYPKLEKVEVLTSPVDIQICKGETICSAEAVIPGFSLPAKAVFAID